MINKLRIIALICFFGSWMLAFGQTGGKDGSGKPDSDGNSNCGPPSRSCNKSSDTRHRDEAHQKGSKKAKKSDKDSSKDSSKK